MCKVSRGMLAAEITPSLIDMIMIVSVSPTALPRESEPSNSIVNRPSLPVLIWSEPSSIRSNGLSGETDANVPLSETQPLGESVARATLSAKPARGGHAAINNPA